MRNEQVAGFFDDIADLLEILEDNVFKIRAYRKAVLNIRSLSEDVEKVAGVGRLEEIPGIGKDLAAKIAEIIKTGKLKHYEVLKRKVPEGMLELMTIPGIGPKKARLLYEKRGIKSLNELEKKAKAHKISGIPGLKDKTEENISRGIELVKKHSARMSLKEALDLSAGFVSGLKKLPAAGKVIAAGSLRRMKDTVRDIDILVTSRKPQAIMDAFVKMPDVKNVLAHGSTKSAVLTTGGVQVDVRVVDENSFGAALVYFTGSQAHNVHIRHIAKRLGLKVNEYGVFDEKTDRKVAGKEEIDIYKALKLPIIPPELREDRGEIEAASKGRLPELIDVSDIKGDLHVHSRWSDGENSIEEIARAAKAKGYEYIAITDHSESLKVAGGLSERDVLKKIDEIGRVRKKVKGITLLAGVEIDILQDGSLDYRKNILDRFDIIVAAIHAGFKQSKETLTARIVKAMETGRVHIISHPTGRLKGARDPYDLALGKIFRAAKQTKTCLEINAFPDRLDLDDINSRAAKEAGVKLAVNTDSHLVDQLDYMFFGVSVARRAWLEKKDVLNTRGLSELLKFLKK